MTEVAAIGFDYNAVPAEKAAGARAAAERIRGRMASAIIETGLDLIQQKDDLGHGNFIPWVRSEFGMSEDTAQKFMRIAKELGSNTESSRHLSFEALSKLAAPSTPDTVREEVLERAAGGEKVTAKEIEDLKKKLRQAEAQAKEAAALAQMREVKAKAAEERREEVIAESSYLRADNARLKAEIVKLHDDGVIHVIKAEPLEAAPLPSSVPPSATPAPPNNNDEMEAARLVAAANAALRALRTPQQWADVASMNAEEWRAAYRSL